jgi:flagellum-specific peptidoglycan hydrolase FlgJ
MEAYANYITTKHGAKGLTRGTKFEDVAKEINIIKNQQKYATSSNYENKIIQIANEIKKYIDDYNK